MATGFTTGSTSGDGAKDALKHAVEAHQRGDLDRAERGYRALLAAQPGHPDALNLLGAVNLQRGRAREAETLIRQAIAATPAQPGFHNNLGEALRALGQPIAAESAYREALRLAPDFQQARCNLALAQLAAGRLDEAAASAAAAREHSPTSVDAHNVVGLVAQARGNAAHAVEAFRHAAKLSPGHVPTLTHLAGALRSLGNHAEAVEVCRQICARAPAMPRAWWMLAETLRVAGDLPGAESAARRAHELAPRVLDPLLSLEAILRAQGRIAESVECLRKALVIAPDRAATHNDLGMSLLTMAETGPACACFERALELDPSIAPAWENLARNGRVSAQAATDLADRVVGRLAAVADQPAASACLDFAVAVWRDRAGDTTRAIEHYRAANRAARRLRRWDADIHSGLVDRLIEVFDAALFADGVPPPLPGEQQALPLLVVGMPRSGTTLVEQILASHPAVHGAGELNLLPGYIERMPAMLGRPWPECARLLDPPKRVDLAGVYCAQLRGLAEHASRVTDKMPSNFLHLGLLALMLPGARVVCCRREPRDIAVSVLTHHFEGGHAWAYDACEVGRYQADHDRLMTHWREVLPLDLHEVVYEELVAEPEARIRALIQWAGLDWHDACLAFHQTRRVVRTASQTQVLEPMNDRSVGRWRRHEALLEGYEAGLAGQRCGGPGC